MVEWSKVINNREFPESLSFVETSGELKKSTLTARITSLHTSVAHRDTKKDVFDLSRFNFKMPNK